MHSRRRHPRAVASRSFGGDAGWAEVVVLGLFATIIGFAFLWALVLHEKPAEDPRSSETTDTSIATGTPPTLPPPRKYKVQGGVNVRQGPGTNTTVITKLDDGTTVTAECRVEGQDVSSPDGSSNQWLRIAVEGGVGYVSALYVNIGDDLDDTTRLGIC
jgi:hypothetical protein